MAFAIISEALGSARKASRGSTSAGMEATARARGGWACRWTWSWSASDARQPHALGRAGQASLDDREGCGHGRPVSGGVHRYEALVHDRAPLGLPVRARCSRRRGPRSSAGPGRDADVTRARPGRLGEGGGASLRLGHRGSAEGHKQSGNATGYSGLAAGLRSELSRGKTSPIWRSGSWGWSRDMLPPIRGSRACKGAGQASGVIERKRATFRPAGTARIAHAWLGRGSDFRMRRSGREPSFAASRR